MRALLFKQSPNSHIEESEKKILQVQLSRVATNTQQKQTNYETQQAMASQRQPPNTDTINLAIERILLDVVIRGHGDRLLGKWSGEPQLQRFLDAVPYMLDRINQLHLTCARTSKLDDEHLHHFTHRQVVRSSSGESSSSSLGDFLALVGDSQHWLVRSRDALGLTPLHKAVLHNNAPIAEHILDRYADEVVLTPAAADNDFDGGDDSDAAAATQQRLAVSLIDARDKFGRSPLHYAAALLASGKPRDARFYYLLVARGASLVTRDFRGKTPAYYARHPKQLRARAVVHLAHKMNANFHATVLSRSLTAAAAGRHMSEALEVRSLLARHYRVPSAAAGFDCAARLGAGVRLLRRQNSDALSEGVSRRRAASEFGGLRESRSQLDLSRCEFSSSPRASSTMSTTMTTVAERIRAHDADVAGLLAEFSRQPTLLETPDASLGLPPLQLAVLFGHARLVAALVEAHPATVDFVDGRFGRSALHLSYALEACLGEPLERAAHRRISQLLLAAGASATLADKLGHTPQHYRLHAAADDALRRALHCAQQARGVDEQSPSSMAHLSPAKSSSTAEAAKAELVSWRAESRVVDAKTRALIAHALSNAQMDAIEALVVDGFAAALIEAEPVACWNVACKRHLRTVLPALMRNVDGLHEAVASNQLLVVRALVCGEPQLARVKRPYKRAAMNALHVAVVLERRAVVAFLADKFPELVESRDSSGCSALHLAARDARLSRLYEWLDEHFGDSLALLRDSRGKLAADYRRRALVQQQSRAPVAPSKQPQRRAVQWNCDSARCLLAKAQCDSNKLFVSGSKARIAPRKTAKPSSLASRKRAAATDVANKLAVVPSDRGQECDSGDKRVVRAVDASVVQQHCADTSVDALHAGFAQSKRRASQQQPSAADNNAAGGHGCGAEWAAVGVAKVDGTPGSATAVEQSALSELPLCSLDDNRSSSTTQSNDSTHGGDCDNDDGDENRRAKSRADAKLGRLIRKSLRAADINKLEHLVIAGHAHKLTQLYAHEFASCGAASNLSCGSSSEEAANLLAAFMRDKLPHFAHQMQQIHSLTHKLCLSSLIGDGEAFKDLFSELEKLVSRKRRFVICRDEFGATPLHIAALFGNERLTRLLVGKHLEAHSAPDIERRSPLHYAAIATAAVECVAPHALIVSSSSSNDNPSTTIVRLAIESLRDTLTVLRARDASDLCDEFNKTPLDYLQDKGASVEFARILTRYNRVICNAGDDDNEHTPLNSTETEAGEVEGGGASDEPSKIDDDVHNDNRQQEEEEEAEPESLSVAQPTFEQQQFANCAAEEKLQQESTSNRLPAAAVLLAPPSQQQPSLHESSATALMPTLHHNHESHYLQRDGSDESFSADEELRRKNSLIDLKKLMQSLTGEHWLNGADDDDDDANNNADANDTADADALGRLSSEFESRVECEKHSLRSKVDQIMEEISNVAGNNKSGIADSSNNNINAHGKHCHFAHNDEDSQDEDGGGEEHGGPANHKSMHVMLALDSAASNDERRKNSVASVSSSNCSSTNSPPNSATPSLVNGGSSVASNKKLAVNPPLQLQEVPHEPPVLSKNAFGQTFLHFAAARTQTFKSFYQLLTCAVHLIGERDVYYRTARDVAVQCNLRSNVLAFDKFIIDSFIKARTEALDRLLVAGYSPLINVSDSDGNDIMLILKLLKIEPMICKMLHMADFVRWRDELHTFIRHGYVAGATALLHKHPDLANSQSPQARTALHLAVLFENVAVVEELLKIDVGGGGGAATARVVKLVDNMGRTALHYSYGLPQTKAMLEIRRKLLAAGSSETTRDVKMRTPKYYSIFKPEIADLKKLELRN